MDETGSLVACQAPPVITTYQVELSRREVVAISNALNEVLRGPQRIENWEFHARIGCSRPKTDDLQARLLALLGDAGAA
jgi:hypothetical protein